MVFYPPAGNKLINAPQPGTQWTQVHTERTTSTLQDEDVSHVWQTNYHWFVIRSHRGLMKTQVLTAIHVLCWLLKHSLKTTVTTALLPCYCILPPLYHAECYTRQWDELGTYSCRHRSYVTFARSQSCQSEVMMHQLGVYMERSQCLNETKRNRN